MTTAQLSTRVRRHNGLQIVIAICGLAVAAPLWALSFWASRTATTSILIWLRDSGVAHIPSNPKTVGLCVALLFVVALAVDGIRRATAPFDLLEFRNSSFFTTGNIRTSSQLTMLWMFVQIFLSAPYMTGVAVIAIRSRLVADPAVLRDAADLLGKLEGERRWVSPLAFGERGQAVKLLHRLHLIWIRDRDGEFQVRFPAGLKPGETL